MSDIKPFATTAEIWWAMAVGGTILTTLGIILTTRGRFDHAIPLLAIGSVCVIGVAITTPEYYKK